MNKMKATKDKSKQTQEQLLAIQIINALNEWISIGSIENWVNAGSHEYILKRKLPKEYHPNHYLEYRLRIRDKLWMEPIRRKLLVREKGDIAEDIKQKRWKFIQEVSTIDENLEPTRPQHLPNLQLVSSAARLANALKEALPCLGLQSKRCGIWTLVKRIPRWIFGLVVAVFVAVIVAIVVEIFTDFGWLERITDFIYRILQLE